MPLRQTLFAAGIATLLSCAFTHAEPPPQRIVMTWVPPYAIEKCRERLSETVNGVGPKDTLTHLALQFWLPTRDGGLQTTPKFGVISDAAILQFRDWGHAHGIRVLLCVYNYLDKWDWPLAQAGFQEHRSLFVSALLAEVQRLGLDGIDIDLEGNGNFPNARGPYLAFIRELSAKLHALHKQLTVDSFAYKWNAPNQSWWPDLFPFVDALNTMGYEEIGAHGSEWYSYAAQKAAAGRNAAKLLIGIPAHQSDWLGASAVEHLDSLAADPNLGIALWDAQFDSPCWRTATPWKALAKIKAGGP